ncbi:uncharacterized protein LOC134239192 [Saccostrea cucullata]|uniref:uncharacterized protein LOC134239192 n=1 Tax=Saccostrea cuccullata TaxID=36930 RepID=UPI002ED69565
MCNPYRALEITIDKCPGNSNDVDHCDFFPKVYFYAPYKNLHCGICNGMGMAVMKGEHGGIEEEEEKLVSNSLVWYPLLRSLFSVSDDYEDMEFNPLMNPICSSDQIYDPFHEICRNITCFPGKYLSHGEKCIPLFSVTKNLRYNLDIEFKGISKYKISEENIQDLITDLIPFRIKKTVKLTQNIYFNIFRMDTSLADSEQENRIWRSTMPRDLKLRFFIATVESILLYGCEIWTLTVAQEKSLDGTYTENATSLELLPSSRAQRTITGTFGPKLRTLRRMKTQGHIFRHT